MYRFIFYVLFSASIYLYVIHQYNKGEVEFGIFKPIIGLLRKITERDIHPAIVSVGVFITLSTLVVLTKVLFELIGNRIEFVYAPVLTGACWMFLRDIKIQEVLERIVNKKIAQVIHLILAITLGWSWFLLPHWMTYNVTAFILAVMAIRAFGPIKLKYLLFALAAVVLYDTVFVLVTKTIVDVMLNMSSGVIPPIIVRVPETTSFMGVADIIYPGLVILAVATIKKGIEWYAFLGYCVGLGLALIVLNLVHRPLPAMVFLVPAVFSAILIVPKAKRMALEWRT